MSLHHNLDPQLAGDEFLQSARRPRVLCIDRDVELGDSIARRLREHHIDVLRARNGMQGYWLAMSKHPDVIITDLRMTNGHGGEILEAVKASPQTQHIPVIVLTAQQYPGLHEHVQRMGAERLFKKPVAVDALVAELAKHINVT